MALLQKKRRVRKYQTYFLTFGFTYQLVNREEYHPQSVVCGEVLGNNSFKAKKFTYALNSKT
jgi:hypothetical protein